MEKIIKNYYSTKEGKKEFVDEVLNPIVKNEGHFESCEYISTPNDGEWIVLKPYDWGNPPNSYRIDVGCDSIEAMCRDFMRGFLRAIGG